MRISDWSSDVCSYDLIQTAAASRSLTARDFATTMVALISVPTGILTAHIGDGAVVGRVTATKEWSVMSAQPHGEYASTTYLEIGTASCSERVCQYESIPLVAASLT